MSNTPVPTQELIAEIRSWLGTNIEHREPEEFKYAILAADRLAELEKLSYDLIAENAGLKNKIDRLQRSVGCARNQGTTQFCQEAVDAHADNAKLKNAFAALDRVAELQAFNDKLQAESQDHLVSIITAAERHKLLIRERDESRARAERCWWLCEQLLIQERDEARAALAAESAPKEPNEA